MELEKDREVVLEKSVSFVSKMHGERIDKEYLLVIYIYFNY